MATDHTRQRRGAMLLAAAACAVAVLLGLWWGRPAEPPPADRAIAAEPVPERVEPTPPEAPPAPPPVPAAPPLPRVDPAGRLVVEATDLPEESFALTLAMSAEARGSDPRPVRIAGVDGRSIETTAVPTPDAEGVRLEIDREWLVPGLYLIEVRTAEKRAHFPARRYVLEIR